ncbi:MAG: hypothetical protein OEM83_09755 [Gammaproteobacteria bacterium]|nr:hypothetical protein [Gammaproteobacteria bacterium]
MADRLTKLVDAIDESIQHIAKQSFFDYSTIFSIATGLDLKTAISYKQFTNPAGIFFQEGKKPQFWACNKSSTTSPRRATHPGVSSADKAPRLESALYPLPENGYE